MRTQVEQSELTFRTECKNKVKYSTVETAILNNGIFALPTVELNQHNTTLKRSGRQLPAGKLAGWRAG